MLLHRVKVSILHTQVLHSGSIKKERSETASLIMPLLNLRMNQAWITAISWLLYLTWAANNHDCPSAVNAKVQSFPMINSSAHNSECHWWASRKPYDQKKTCPIAGNPTSLPVCNLRKGYRTFNKVQKKSCVFRAVTLWSLCSRTTVWSLLPSEGTSWVQTSVHSDSSWWLCSGPHRWPCPLFPLHIQLWRCHKTDAFPQIIFPFKQWWLLLWWS